MNKKIPRYSGLIGLFLCALSLLVSIILGFGGFSMQAFSGYVITGHISRFQMIFLTLAGIGLMLSGIGYADQARKQNTKNPNFILLFCLAVSIVFFSTSVFALTSQLRGSDYWGNCTFEEIEDVLFFNSLTLASFLALGVLQVTLSIIFFKSRMIAQHQLSKAAKYLTLISGMLFILKTIIDAPLLKQAIFILSYMLKIPFLNNILSLVAPLVYLFAQILVAIIMLQSLKATTSH